MKIEILPQMSVRDRIGESHVTCHNDVITTKQLSYQLRIPKTEEISNLYNLNTISRVGQIMKSNQTHIVIQ